jgi:WD40 repeat protein
MREPLDSLDLIKAWRYAIDTDFQCLAPGETGPMETVTMTYDTHERFIPFQRQSDRQAGHVFAISSDERWLAHGAETKIDLYDMSSGERVKTLMGHTVTVDSLAFAPNHPHTLVSSAASRHIEGAEIIVWGLKEQLDRSNEQAKIETGDIARDAVDHIQTSLGKATSALSLGPDDTEVLTTVLQVWLDRFLGRSSLPPNARRLSGRLRTFNNAGTAFIVLPALSTRVDGDAKWDFKVYDLALGRETVFSGHRDSIAWIGFSPDDSLIVSASRDGTFRVWRADTGDQVHVWTTDKQNRTGCFAPDNDRFLGIDAQGKIWVWSLSTGDLLWSFEDDHAGGRSRQCVDWSRDGKYIIVGGEGFGEILLFEVSSDPNVGPIRPAQRRILSVGKSRMSDDPLMARWARKMLNVNSLQFVYGDEDDDDEVVFGSTTYIDLGVEFVSLTRGKRWRIIPFERADDDDAEFDRLDKEGWTVQPRWFALKRSRQVVVISCDGARFWKLT